MAPLLARLRLGQAVRALAGHTDRRYRDREFLPGGDYLTPFGLDRCCDKLAIRPDLARQYDVPSELSEVAERTHEGCSESLRTGRRGTPGRCLAGRRSRGLGYVMGQPDYPGETSRDAGAVLGKARATGPSPA